MRNASRKVDTGLAWPGVKEDIGTRKSPIIKLGSIPDSAVGHVVVVRRYRELKTGSQITHRSLWYNDTALSSREFPGFTYLRSYSDFKSNWEQSVDHMWVR